MLIASELNVRWSRFNRACLHPRSFVTSEGGGSGGSRYPHQGDLNDPIRFVGKVQPQTPTAVVFTMEYFGVYENWRIALIAKSYIHDLPWFGSLFYLSQKLQIDLLKIFANMPCRAVINKPFSLNSNYSTKLYMLLIKSFILVIEFSILKFDWN